MNPTIKKSIKSAIDNSPRNAYVAELHVQVLKYAEQLANVPAKEFCEALAIPYSYGTEYSKMIKIAPRLRRAGLDSSKI